MNRLFVLTWNQRLACGSLMQEHAGAVFHGYVLSRFSHKLGQFEKNEGHPDDCLIARAPAGQ